MSTTDLEEARAAVGAGSHDPWPPNGNGGASVAERVADGEGEPTESDLFPKGVLDADGKVSLKNLIRAGEAVEVTASLMSAEVPLRGGLVDPRKDGQVLVSFEAARYIPVPQREGEPGSKQVKGWKIRCQLRPTYVQPVADLYTRQQVIDILHKLGLTADADAVREALGDE